MKTVVSGVIEIIGSAARAEPTNNRLRVNQKPVTENGNAFLIVPPVGWIAETTLARSVFSFMCCPCET